MVPGRNGNCMFLSKKIILFITVTTNPDWPETWHELLLIVQIWSPASSD